MKTLLLAVLSTSVLAAAQVRPVLEASGGMAFPEISGSNDAKEQNGWALRAGGGVAIPMGAQADALLTGQFAMAAGGGKESDDDVTAEYNFTPRFLELDASVLWKASPQFGLLGGFVMSIPMGGTYELDQEVDGYPSASISDDGDIDDLADQTNSDINTFSNLKLGGAYFLDESKALQVAYLLPLGKYMDGKYFGVKIARLVAGISFRI